MFSFSEDLVNKITRIIIELYPLKIQNPPNRVGLVVDLSHRQVIGLVRANPLLRPYKRVLEDQSIVIISGCFTFMNNMSESKLKHGHYIAIKKRENRLAFPNSGHKPSRCWVNQVSGHMCQGLKTRCWGQTDANFNDGNPLHGWVCTPLACKVDYTWSFDSSTYPNTKLPKCW